MLKTRDPRLSVLVPAQLRAGSGWAAAWVHNVSRRGMMLSCAMPPELGSFIEIRLDEACYAAKIVWVRDQRFGVRTREAVQLAADAAAALAPGTKAAGSRKSPDQKWADARATGRLVEFTAAAAIGALLAAAAAALSWYTLASVVAKIEQQLL
ncbi:MAG TPA: PilZ domain-containing protein [Sphingomonas sp.]|nr:PilZ domain-containing protein [Sphingomonas sp.]